jgi:hypothetical protein
LLDVFVFPEELMTVIESQRFDSDEFFYHYLVTAYIYLFFNPVPNVTANIKAIRDRKLAVSKAVRGYDDEALPLFRESKAIADSRERIRQSEELDIDLFRRFPDYQDAINYMSKFPVNPELAAAILNAEQKNRLFRNSREGPHI